MTRFGALVRSPMLAPQRHLRLPVHLRCSPVHPEWLYPQIHCFQVGNRPVHLFRRNAPTATLVRRTPSALSARWFHAQGGLMRQTTRRTAPIYSTPAVNHRSRAAARTPIAASMPQLLPTARISHNVIIPERLSASMSSHLTTTSLSEMTTFPRPQIRLAENTVKCRHFCPRPPGASAPHESFRGRTRGTDRWYIQATSPP